MSLFCFQLFWRGREFDPFERVDFIDRIESESESESEDGGYYGYGYYDTDSSSDY